MLSLGHSLVFAGLGVLVLGALYLIKLNHALLQVPKEVHDISPRRWTKEEIRDTYARVQKAPFDWKPHLPSRLKRRYIIVGGSGTCAERGRETDHLLAF